MADTASRKTTSKRSVKARAEAVAAPATAALSGAVAQVGKPVAAAALKPAPASRPSSRPKPATAPTAGTPSLPQASPLSPTGPIPRDGGLRALMQDCRHLLSERGEANGPGIAQAIVGQIERLSDEQGARFFDHLARDFSPDPKKVLAAALAYSQAPSKVENLIQLTETAEPPRQELFRRLNRAPGGTAAIVRLRRTLLARLPQQAVLAGVEHDLLHLLSSWFNPGFLQMRKVDWNSPAQLLEQIIRHEAVHQIDGWDDLRRRLQPDRRCFAFFHPQLPDQPLIFVEVALLAEMADAVAPLIDKKSPPVPAEAARVAVFYSISNCQPGLRGVSLGNFLIKRVAEQLKRELPQLKTFCTLSPIPALMGWLARARDGSGLAGLPVSVTERAVHALAQLRGETGDDFSLLANAASLAALPASAHHALWRLAAIYLVHLSATAGGDPVARFHLDNGARLERLNAQADLSPKGLKQSAGLMVNYLYDLGRIETCHDRFVKGRVVHSRAISALL